MTVRITTRVTRTGSLSKVAREQVPFALSRTLNRVVEGAQGVIRGNLPRTFTLRRKTFIERLVFFGREDRADKRKLVARLRTRGPASAQDRGNILAQHERGGDKRPRDGGRIAIPVAVKRTKADVIRKDQRPRALLGKGEAKAFISKDGKAILQRVGRGKQKALRVAYILKPRARLRPTLDWVNTFTRTVQRDLHSTFREELANAVRSARPRR